MERNLNRRVEVLSPVIDPDLKRSLRHVVLAAYLRDNVRAHVLRADGTYRLVSRPADEAPFSAQDFLLSHATVQQGVPPSDYEVEAPREEARSS